jgi:hypothetical protein
MHPLAGFQHFSFPQSQAFTSWLYSGEQPQGAIRQVLGKSPADWQHDLFVTAPPEPVHRLSIL